MAYAPIDVEAINWDQFLNVQEGGQMDRYFVGQRYMRGYGVLGSIGKFLLPIAKNLASTVGSEGLEAGKNLLKDVTEGKDFSEALKEHSKKGFENVTSKMKQCGKGHTQKGRGFERFERTARQAREKKKTTTLGYSRISKKSQRAEMRPSFSMYPTRPASPTVAPLKARERRKRKPDQLDMF
jgi:hypothetical protein